MSTLFDPIRIGSFTAANRVAMAPLTRNRASPERVPTELMIEYYRQRATAGLIVTEATQISPQGQGYLDTPGLYNDAQVAAWRRITDAVHAAGGRIVVQLWHVGRVSHVSLLPGGVAPVSSTARPADTKTYIAGGFAATSVPRALRTDELPGIVEDYRQAARRAIAAGFDGVELHAANGYLIEQFLRDSCNDRTDAYGGPKENRVRLLVEALQAITGEIGGERTGIRLSPVSPSNGVGMDSDPQGLFNHAMERIAPMKLAYVHVIEGATGGPRDDVLFDFAALQAIYKAGNPAGVWVGNNGYTRQLALDAVASGRVDMVAFGKPFIANPDLVERLRRDAPLGEPQRATFYGGGAEGYTDYPALTE